MDTKTRGVCIATRCSSVDEFVDRFHAYCEPGSMFVTTKTTRPVGAESPFVITLADKTIVMRGWCIVFDAYNDSSNPFGRIGMRLGIHRLTSSSKTIFDRLLAVREAAIAAGKPVRFVTQMMEIVPPEVTAPSVRTAVTVMGMPAIPMPAVRKPKARPLTLTIPALRESPRVEEAAPASASDGPTERMSSPPLHMLPRDNAEPAALIVSVPPRAGADSDPPPVSSHSTSQLLGRLVKGSGAVPRLARSIPIPTPIFAEGSSETRTPGSHLVLPANPLENLTDALLAGFIDGQIYDDRAPIQGHIDVVPLPPPPPAASVLATTGVPSAPEARKLGHRIWRFGWQTIAVIAMVVLLAVLAIIRAYASS